ncbi:P-loop containing nucleoside triphosphate hydrolase protein [Lobosporangium transversale]|uniref:p-loop containing nucleoside triphosphate hydrolase protein n=1 Tax=Lobosporangium transversale TaxID=64571 RepID=A0A1Y2GBH1_9FUNG|nr:P-loop containing nucleoside triphosphate hydrolase protein [Lobosporangium transversale]ORZ06323.1 P-loop containing nucleoside triphosphate hydrolase protein [Lobosporangium transversale]|eukprot:XP_021877486.1 P-loop containing nucleoside triphosphate hydrolase protein [Lobosporangium transversale]
MSALHFLLKRSDRIVPVLSYQTFRRCQAISWPFSSSISCINNIISTGQQYFSTSSAVVVYAKRAPRPKQRIIKEQKLKATRSSKHTTNYKSTTLPHDAKPKSHQWKKLTLDTSESSGMQAKVSSPRKRIISTSVSVTSLERGSRNPQLEHSFAPGFASFYKSKGSHNDLSLKTGNAGRDKAAAAERALIKAGAKRKLGPKVRGFVPVRFALKPIASDVSLNLISNRNIPISKYKMNAQTGLDKTSNEEVFAKELGDVQEMMDKVASSRFQDMGIHPDVEKGVMELLSKSVRVSKSSAIVSNESLESIRPTEIQALTIPAAIDPKKKSPYTLCAAETGSGKTLAYLIPVLHQLKVQEDEAISRYQSEGGIDAEGSKVRALNTIRHFNQPRAIVLLPSRELVAQVSSILKDLSHSIKVRALAISHAMAPKSIIQRLESGPVDIIVATPSSLLDYLPKEAYRSNHKGENDRKIRGSAGLLEDNKICLDSLIHLVIDEADSMFDRGFGDEVSIIVKQARVAASNTRYPTNITVVSATLPKKVSDTLDETLPGILKITTPSLHKSLPGLHQTFLDLKPYFGNRPKAILDILAKQQQIAGSKRKENTLIFCNTKHSCEILYEHLKTNKVPGLLGVLHGDASNRNEILEQFMDDDYIPPPPGLNTMSKGSAAKPSYTGGKVLISTDIASRGIDTTAVNHVVLYDFPVTIVDYLHRVGRTARGGRGGRATSLVGRKDRNLAERIMMGIRMGKVLS